MTNNLGKLIVIDGTDGAGKTTQLKLLRETLEYQGYQIEEADFPQYNTKSAGLVEEYLSGKYGDSKSVTAYQAAIFYAADRYDASFQIRQWLKEGKIVLSNRYVSSSLGHQGGKIDNPLERRLFFNWLYDLEYKIFNLPRPDLSLILYLEPEIAQQLAKERQREDWKGKTKDIHEDDLNHLKKAAQIFLEVADTFPDFRLIRCSHHGQILSRSDIHYLVGLQVAKILNGQKTVAKNNWQAVGNILINNNGMVNYDSKIIAVKKNIENINAPTINSTLDLEEVIKQSNEEQIIEKPTDQTINPSSENNSLSLKFEKIVPQAKTPERAHPGDAGLDLFASDNYSIPPYGQALIQTGLKLAIPSGYVGLIWDKSGLASQGYTTMGGVIDENYRGEIKVIFKNLSEDIVNIQAGQKIAQLLIQKVEIPDIIEEKVEINSPRGDQGFGSSGQF